MKKSNKALFYVAIIAGLLGSTLLMPAALSSTTKMKHEENKEQALARVPEALQNEIIKKAKTMAEKREQCSICQEVCLPDNPNVVLPCKDINIVETRRKIKNKPGKTKKHMSVQQAVKHPICKSCMISSVYQGSLGNEESNAMHCPVCRIKYSEECVNKINGYLQTVNDVHDRNCVQERYNRNYAAFEEYLAREGNYEDAYSDDEENSLGADTSRDSNLQERIEDARQFDRRRMIRAALDQLIRKSSEGCISRRLNTFIEVAGVRMPLKQALMYMGQCCVVAGVSGAFSVGVSEGVASTPKGFGLGVLAPYALCTGVAVAKTGLNILGKVYDRYVSAYVG